MKDDIFINIWDDFEENSVGVKSSKTHIQIESNQDFNLKEQKEILIHFYPVIQKNFSQSKIILNHYNTKTLYPEMDQNACEQSGFKHFESMQLILDGVTHKQIDRFLHKVKDKVFSYYDHKVYFISES